MYYPKSQIIPNLYTNGGEYATSIKPEEQYVGDYYTTSKGEAFTGKEPNSGGNIRLIPFSPMGRSKTSYPKNSPDVLIESTLNLTDFPFEDDIPYNLVNNQSNYTKLKNFKSRKIPNYYVPQPTLNEINKGYNRYFAKKTTELLYLEINFEDYNLLASKDKTIAFDLYEAVPIFWSNIGTVNEKKVLKIEKNYKWYGFSSIFNNNFSTTTQSLPLYLYTEGNEFLLPNRKSYMGYYHQMPDGDFMTGKSHGDGPEIVLIPLKLISNPTTVTSPILPSNTDSTLTLSPTPSNNTGGSGY